jgi:hypothetical protein
MRTHSPLCRTGSLWLAAMLLLCAGTGIDWNGHIARADGNANGGTYVVRMEEDWTLLVNQPDGSTSSPQVSTQMARAPYSLRFCNFHINSCDVPTFRDGGLQLQSWQGTVNQSALSIGSAKMSTNNELVSWTQYIRNNGGSLFFGVSAASSTTWGDFSGQEIAFPSHSTYLDDYSPDYSVSNSGVTYGANRVASLVLVGVRT